MNTALKNIGNFEAYSKTSLEVIERKDNNVSVEEIKRSSMDSAFNIAFRLFQAAQTQNMLQSWTAVKTAIDKDIQQGLAIVRARVRDLVKNNDYARRILNRFKELVIGKDGFQLEMDIKLDNSTNSDELANLKIEEAYNKWCKKKYCTMSGRFSMTKVEELAITQLIRDGEFIARKIMVSIKVNPFGYSLELIDPEFLDETYTKDLGNGEFVVMGVKFKEGNWNRPVSYFFKEQKSYSQIYGGYFSAPKREIDASEIIHVYDLEHAVQSRGMSQFVQTLIRLKKLETWEDYNLDNAAASAKIFQWLEENPSQFPQKKYEGDGTDKDGNATLNIAGGLQIPMVPRGYKMTVNKPEFPSPEYEMFKKGNLEAGASGMGMNYGPVSGNMSDQNYTVYRNSTVEENGVIERWRKIIREELLEPNFEAWLTSALATPEINLPYAKFDKFNQPTFIIEAREPADPKSEVYRMKIELELGTSNLYREWRKKGLSPRKEIKDLERSKKVCDDLGLPWGIGTGAQAPQDEPAPAKPNNDSADAKPKNGKAKSILEFINMEN